MTDDLPNVININKKIKERSNVPIVWGGIHPTIRPAESLEYTDMVCIGEGEESFVELAGKIRDKKNFHNIQGMWFQHNGKIIQNPLRPLIEDLDSLPFQDYDNHNHYILIDGNIRQLDLDLLKKCISQYYMTLTSRGCPFQCTYCWNHSYNRIFRNQQIIRKRSAANVIHELTNVKNRFPFIRMVALDDDAFFMRTEGELLDFSKKYKEKIDLPLWITGATPTTLTRKKISILVDAGLTSLRMGIQTGSERIRRMYKRNYSNQQVEESVRMIHEFKETIPVPQYDIILDNPWETENDVIETLIFLAGLPPSYEVLFFPLILYPGTDLFELAQKDGMMPNDPHDIWRIRHHHFRDSYLNRLFFLLNEYAKRGRKIPVTVMHLLTNRKLRKMKVNILIFLILTRRIHGGLSPRIKYLFSEGLKDLKKGDARRIRSYIRKRVEFYKVGIH